MTFSFGARNKLLPALTSAGTSLLDYRRDVSAARPHGGQDKGRNGSIVIKYCDNLRVNGRRIFIQTTRYICLYVKILKMIWLVKDLKCAIVDQMNFCIATTFSKEYTVYTHTLVMQVHVKATELPKLTESGNPLEIRNWKEKGTKTFFDCACCTQYKLRKTILW
jgi:hypothetical protein